MWSHPSCSDSTLFNKRFLLVLIFFIFLCSSSSLFFGVPLQLFTLEVSPLVVSFILVLVFVVFSVFIFMDSYSQHESWLSSFTMSLSLFVASILLLIVSSSWLSTFIAWEGLGLTSLLLVVFFNSAYPVSATLKTAIINRVGDVSLLLASILFFVSSSFLLLLFTLVVSALTKSAQFPFFSWLPAAIAAPTPVSALVHSSTLVTAGVWLAFSCSLGSAFLLGLGVLSSLYGGLMALRDSDLKKVVAFSTLRQLGLMFVSISLLSPSWGVFYLLLHAFFKSLLFITVGMVIFRSLHSQLSSQWLVSPSLFLCSLLSLSLLSMSGLPFLSAFFIKHGVSFTLSEVSLLVFVFFMFITFITSLYSFQLLSVLSQVRSHPVSFQVSLFLVSSSLLVFVLSFMFPLELSLLSPSSLILSGLTLSGLTFFVLLRSEVSSPLVSSFLFSSSTSVFSLVRYSTMLSSFLSDVSSLLVLFSFLSVLTRLVSFLLTPFLVLSLLLLLWSLGSCALACHWRWWVDRIDLKSSSQVKTPSFTEVSSSIPVLLSLFVFFMVFSFVLFLSGSSGLLILVGFLSLLFVVFMWSSDNLTHFTLGSSLFTKMFFLAGFVFFVLSEVCFFGTFFWSFFHMAVVPVVESGSEFPSFSVLPISPFGVPLFNTFILLSSGVTVTLAHKAVILNESPLLALVSTVYLGFEFLLIQISEYKSAPFSISDSGFGSAFFILTGFHGLHVLVGAILLSICSMRSFLSTSSSHVGLQCSIWYWHFVDVVWLFLFSFVYVWACSTLVCVRLVHLVLVCWSVMLAVHMYGLERRSLWCWWQVRLMWVPASAVILLDMFFSRVHFKLVQSVKSFTR